MKSKIFISTVIIFILWACKSEEIIVPNNAPKAYVINGGSNTISIIDLEKFEVIDSIKIGKSKDVFFAHHGDLSDDKTFLSVALPQGNFANHDEIHNAYKEGKKGSVWVLNPITLKPITEFEVTGINYNTLITKDNIELWTSTFAEEGLIYVYNFKSKKITHRINVLGNPSELILTPDKTKVVFAQTHSSFIQFVDIETKEIVKNIKVDNQPTNVWAGEKYVFVENSTLQLISFIDPIKMEGLKTFSFDFSPINVSQHPLSKDIWICPANENAIYVYKEVNLKLNLISKINLPNKPHMAVFKDSKALVSSSSGNEVYIIDTKTFIINKTLSVGKAPNEILL